MRPIMNWPGRDRRPGGILPASQPMAKTRSQPPANPTVDSRVRTAAVAKNTTSKTTTSKSKVWDYIRQTKGTDRAKK
jgi:hypothetical protein